MPNFALDDELTAIVEALRNSYVTEKDSARRTTRLLQRARAAGIEYKVLALDIAEHLPSATNENVVERAEKLEVALRQRLAQHRRRPRVIPDHEYLVAPSRRHRRRSPKEVTPMPDDRFGRPKYVREREIYYDEMPPDAASCPPSFDSDLGEALPISDHDLDEE